MQSAVNAVIPARLHASGFEKSDSNFYSLSPASDGNVYYTLCSHDLNTHGRVYRYEPSADRVTLLGDLGEVTGEAGRKTIPQGKSHVPFFECDGKLYFCTQYGFFQSSGDKEQPAGVPEGYKPYPGGHFLSYDLATGRFEDLAIGAAQEGIISMQLDPVRKRIYGLTWPKSYFLVYDISARRVHNLGKVCGDGEVGEGQKYFCLCRSLGLWPETGDVFFTNAEGEILQYSFARDTVAPMAGVHMKRDIFGAWDPHKPGHQGYNWRDLFWHEADKVFYGVHPKSAWLFRFDPAAPRLTVVDRILRAGTPGERAVRTISLRLSLAAARPRRPDCLLPHEHLRLHGGGRPAGEGGRAPGDVPSAHRTPRRPWRGAAARRPLSHDGAHARRSSEREAVLLPVDRGFSRRTGPQGRADLRSDQLRCARRKSP